MEVDGADRWVGGDQLFYISIRALEESYIINANMYLIIYP